MPDAKLCGNGEDCPSCALRRADDPWQTGDYPCNTCNGTGRIAWSEARIIADAVAWAKQHYWPQFDSRIEREDAGEGPWPVTPPP